MSYSCSALAMARLNHIMEFSGCAESNTWMNNKGQKFFYETGRSNADGSVTAPVMKFVGKNQCKRAGSIRIEPNGRVTRFPNMNYGMQAAKNAELKTHNIPLFQFT